MEVSLLRLSSRGLDKKNSEEKKWLPGNPPMISWRRGTLAISQCLALNLHTVLTALVIWFLRWQIRNSKLQVGRLLVAGLWKQKRQLTGRQGKHMCEPLLRAVFLVLLGRRSSKKKMLKPFPLFRKLLDICLHSLWATASPLLWLLLGARLCLSQALASGRLSKGIISKGDYKPKDISRMVWGLGFKASEWVELRVPVNLFLLVSSYVFSVMWAVWPWAGSFTLTAWPEDPASSYDMVSVGKHTLSFKTVL